ncbi:MAG: hypothetical protein L0323_24380, partial [Planctomycetes bacterium]|nr:hypothetical protein [Planctomycetota bacterium]
TAPPDVVAEVRAMRERLEKAAETSCLKAGRGGVQDAEFLVQALVLRHGPGNPVVRGPNSVDALTALRDARVLAPAEHEGIVTAYLFLRTVELRLRLSGEGVGSRFPEDPEARGALARRLGYVDTSCAPASRSLAEEVAWYRDRLRTLYERVMGREARGGESEAAIP